VVQVGKNAVRVKIDQGFLGAGTVHTVKLSKLQVEQPDPAGASAP
jgi:hypothetical protein